MNDDNERCMESWSIPNLLIAPLFGGCLHFCVCVKVGLVWLMVDISIVDNLRAPQQQLRCTKRRGWIKLILRKHLFFLHSPPPLTLEEARQIYAWRIRLPAAIPFERPVDVFAQSIVDCTVR